MTRGPLWTRILEQAPAHAGELRSASVPTSYGVYAWLRGGEPVYAGRAVGGRGLRGRVWSEHMSESNDLSRSSFRRNVCDHLGIAPTSVSRARPTRLSGDDVAPVNTWIRECQVIWIEFDSKEEAMAFEAELLAEWKPPLNRR